LRESCLLETPEVIVVGTDIRDVDSLLQERLTVNVCAALAGLEQLLAYVESNEVAGLAGCDMWPPLLTYSGSNRLIEALLDA